MDLKIRAGRVLMEGPDTYLALEKILKGWLARYDMRLTITLQTPEGEHFDQPSKWPHWGKLSTKEFIDMLMKEQRINRAVLD